MRWVCDAPQAIRGRLESRPREHPVGRAEKIAAREKALIVYISAHPPHEDFSRGVSHAQSLQAQSSDFPESHLQASLQAQSPQAQSLQTQSAEGPESHLHSAPQAQVAAVTVRESAAVKARPPETAVRTTRAAIIRNFEVMFIVSSRRPCRSACIS